MRGCGMHVNENLSMKITNCKSKSLYVKVRPSARSSCSHYTARYKRPKQMTSVIQINKKTNGINFMYKNFKKITQEPHQQTTTTVHRFCLIFPGAHERTPNSNQGSRCLIFNVLNLFVSWWFCFWIGVVSYLRMIIRKKIKSICVCVSHWNYTYQNLRVNFQHNSASIVKPYLFNV